MTAKSPSIFTREFVLLNIVLGCGSAVMALFFQFHQYLLSLGIDPRWHGFLIGSDAVTGIVLQPVLSPYLHRGNAKRVAAIGVIIMAISLVLYNFSMTTASIACVRILHGTGFAVLLTAVMVLFACHITPGRSGESIGVISITRLIPYAIIPPVVVYLAGRAFGFLSLVTIMAGLTLLFLIPLCFVRSAQGEEHSLDKGTGLKGLAEDLRSGPVRVLLAVNVLFYSAYTSLFFFFRDFGAARGMQNPGFFFTIAMVAMIVVRLCGSRYFDRAKKALTAAVCLGALALCNVILGYSRGEGVLIVLAVAFGLLWGMGMPLMMAFIFDISEARFRGLNMNLSLVMMQAGFFLGPFIGGLFLARFGYGMLFIFCGALNAVGAAMLLSMGRDRAADQRTGPHR